MWECAPDELDAYIAELNKRAADQKKRAEQARKNSMRRGRR